MYTGDAGELQANMPWLLHFRSLVGGDDEEEDEDEGEFNGGRYKPVMKKILQGLVGAADPLSFEDFPSVMPMPESNATSGTAASARRKKKAGGVEGSARKGGGQKRWNTAHGGNNKGKGNAPTYTGGRSIVFTIGGMAYSEMKVARDVMEKENREIVFGSTSFITAKDLVDDMAKLS